VPVSTTRSTPARTGVVPSWRRRPVRRRVGTAGT
jgi:hypothetical protein